MCSSISRAQLRLGPGLLETRSLAESGGQESNDRRTLDDALAVAEDLGHDCGTGTIRQQIRSECMAGTCGDFRKHRRVRSLATPLRLLPITVLNFDSPVQK